MPNKQDELDQIKLRLAKIIVLTFTMPIIRAKGISNLKRWKSQGTWCSAYDEWFALLDSGSDEEIVRAMTAEDHNSNRLRQSPPYPGLLDQQTVQRVYKTPKA